ncbi:MAG: hypothetical protein D6689_04980 [Deltaproteobacteria bacterium]|nr:MAG: hypothetical protein D6689_04980 [Deltaproteobacteria bacterium]
MGSARFALLGAAVVAAVAWPPARAGARPSHRASYHTDKTFGLGLMFGSPTGLSGKLHLDAPIALAFGVGSSYYGHHDHHGDHVHIEGTQLHADVLWHPAVLVHNPTLQLALHIGVGGQVRHHHVHDPEPDDGHTHVGVRVPFGLTMDFRRAPVDAFFELAYALEFVGPGSHSYIAGSLGARYYPGSITV